LDTNRACSLDKLFNADFKVIQTGIVSNCGEFAIIKIGVVEFFPNTDILESIPITQPIGYKEFTVFCFKHVCQTDIILRIDLEDCYLCALYIQFVRHLITLSFTKI
jgi:hypothetical protein